MTKTYDLEDRTLEFAKNVIRLCKMFQKDIINTVLISQLVRSGCSIGANYREANESLSKKDFIHRMKISRKEAKETQYWLDIILEANQNHKGNTEELLREAIELKKIFSSIIDKSQNSCLTASRQILITKTQNFL